MMNNSKQNKSLFSSKSTLANILKGMEKAAGHVDYYPNGGEDQPGCGLEFGSCSHGRAPEMYLKSIALPPNSSDCYFRS